MPNDDAANKLGGPSSGPESPVMLPTDTSALMLGKSGQRSGAIAKSSVSPGEGPVTNPAGQSNPWAVSAKGTASAVGGLVAKLKSHFRRGN